MPKAPWQVPNAPRHWNLLLKLLKKGKLPKSHLSPGRWESHWSLLLFPISESLIICHCSERHEAPAPHGLSHLAKAARTLWRLLLPLTCMLFWSRQLEELIPSLFLLFHQPWNRLFCRYLKNWCVAFAWHSNAESLQVTFHQSKKFCQNPMHTAK